MELVFLLEEESMKAALSGLLPRLLPEGITYRLIPHEGKSDLEKSIPRKLRAWNDPNARFIVVRDKDAANCVDVKAALKELCAQAGHPDALVRIACRELESWFLGDLLAVETGLQVKNLARQQQTRKFRSPDDLGNPVQELKRLLGKRPYGKIAGARAIGPHLDLQTNRSRSFNAFVNGVLALATGGIA